MTNMATAMAAPVLPADTKADACPSRTSSAATRRDESRLRLSACDGLSAMPTTWEACRISTPGRRPPRRSSSRSMAVWSPTRTTDTPNSCRATMAPSTTTAGPWSPPMASTAIFMRASGYAPSTATISRPL